MRLIGSAVSPFVRKVRAVALERGLKLDFETIDSPALMASDAVVGAVAPLGKVPALVTADLGVLYDSRVICSYLDLLGSGVPLYGDNPGERIRAMRAEALADGIADAGVLIRLEPIFHPDGSQSDRWLDRQHGKVSRGVAAAAQLAPALAERSIGALALACHLDWLDFRLPHVNWRGQQPALADWIDTILARPSLQTTDPRLAG